MILHSTEVFFFREYIKTHDFRHVLRFCSTNISLLPNFLKNVHNKNWISYQRKIINNLIIKLHLFSCTIFRLYIYIYIYIPAIEIENLFYYFQVFKQIKYLGRKIISCAFMKSYMLCETNICKVVVPLITLKMTEEDETRKLIAISLHSLLKLMKHFPLYK